MKKLCLFFAFALSTLHAWSVGQIRPSDINAATTNVWNFTGQFAVGSGTPAHATVAGSLYATNAFEAANAIYFTSISGPAIVYLDSSHQLHALTLDASLSLTSGTLGVVSLAGDVTGAPGANTVTKIRGFTVPTPASPGDDGKVLTFNASALAWTLPAVTAVSGTTNGIPKFTSSSALGSSLLTDNGTGVGVNETNPQTSFVVGSTSTFAIEMPPPATPTGTPAATGGLLADATYYYRVTASEGNGHTLPSTESAAITVSGGGGNGSISLAWTATGGAVSYDVYRTTTSGSYGASSFVGTVRTNALIDCLTTPTTGTLPTTTTAYLTKIAPFGTASYIMNGQAFGFGTGKPSVGFTFGAAGFAADIQNISITSAVASASGGSMADGPYYYAINQANQTALGGISKIGPDIKTFVSGGGGHGSVTLTWTPTPGHWFSRIYRTQTPGVYGANSLIATINGFSGTFTDTLATPSAGTPPLTTNAQFARFDTARFFFVLPYIGFGTATVGATTINSDKIVTLGGYQDEKMGLERNPLTSGAGHALAIVAGSPIAALSNSPGGDMSLACGFGTGNSTGCNVNVQTGTVGSSGTSDESVATRAVFNQSGLQVTGYITHSGQTRAASDFTASATTTLANVTGLSVSVASGGTYSFRAVLFVDADVVGGQKYAIAGTATATSIIYQVNTLNDSTNAFVITSRQTALAGSVGQAGSSTNMTTIEGTITVNAAGTLTTQFAQNAASGTSTVKAGSTFIVQQIL